MPMCFRGRVYTWALGDPRDHVSLTASRANLSCRTPSSRGWRSLPCTVHSRKATCTTISGRTQCHRTASLSKWGLLSPNTWGNQVLVDGYTPRPDEDLRCYGQIVGPRFFETFGIPLRSGREFGPQDGPTAPRVAVINETMARHFFGHEDPVGRRFRLPAKPGVAIEIVGVAKDAKY